MRETCSRRAVEVWLDVKFAESMVQVPLRISTQEEEKVFRKSWRDIKKEHNEAMQ